MNILGSPRPSEVENLGRNPAILFTKPPQVFFVCLEEEGPKGKQQSQRQPLIPVLGAHKNSKLYNLNAYVEGLCIS